MNYVGFNSVESRVQLTKIEFHLHWPFRRRIQPSIPSRRLEVGVELVQQSSWCLIPKVQTVAYLQTSNWTTSTSSHVDTVPVLDTISSCSTSRAPPIAPNDWACISRLRLQCLRVAEAYLLDHHPIYHVSHWCISEIRRAYQLIHFSRIQQLMEHVSVVKICFSG